MAGRAGVNEDFLEYYLFPEFTANSDRNRQKEILEELADLYVAHLSNYLVPYIWQNESFKLTVVDRPLPEKKLPPHLYGCVHFGDNIEDEWFILFLIVQLTQHFSNLVARITDNDGDFMLIEAADYLPKWMNPETTENRVYVYQGNIHILPLAQTPQQLTSIPSGTPSISDAVTAVRSFSKTTKADKKIQAAIFKKIGRYPEKIKEDVHRSHCFVPVAVAALLESRPSLVAASINAFYLRDAIDLKACRAMKYFPPETRVMTNVVFTRCLYAQLMQQKYLPDKRTGWSLPPPNSPQFKACDLGMKLACGFEILVANSKPKTGSGAQSSSEIENLEDDRRWLRYLDSLKSKGFFRGELEHSKVYSELLEKAKRFYVINMKQHDKCPSSTGEDIRTLLNTLEVDMEHFKEKAKSLGQCDDDSWLTVSPDRLEAILREYGNQDADGLVDAEKVSNDISSGLKEFVSHVSSYEGAEFPKSQNRDNRVTFDPDSFADAMQSILDFKVPEWDERSKSSSGMSDYSDEDDEIDLSKPTRDGKNAMNADEFSTEMQAYMEEMDRELASTTVGQSFERVHQATSNSSTRAPLAEKSDDLEDYQPVNVDLTTLKNILQSYQAQQGLAGPASNILESMGIQIPQDVETCD